MTQDASNAPADDHETRTESREPLEAPDVVAGAADAASDAASAEKSGPVKPRELPDLEQEGEIAADYLEGLLDIVDMDGDLDIDVENDRAVVAIVGGKLDALVGAHGTTLDALQELTRLTVLQRTGNRSRLMLDIAGYRAQRKVDLTAIGVAAAERVKATGASERLAPMTPFERKIVHDAVGTVEGVGSASEGEEPQRRVVVVPD